MKNIGNLMAESKQDGEKRKCRMPHDE